MPAKATESCQRKESFFPLDVNEQRGSPSAMDCTGEKYRKYRNHIYIRYTVYLDIYLDMYMHTSHKGAHYHANARWHASHARTTHAHTDMHARARARAYIALHGERRGPEGGGEGAHGQADRDEGGEQDAQGRPVAPVPAQEPGQAPVSLTCRLSGFHATLAPAAPTPPKLPSSHFLVKV